MIFAVLAGCVPTTFVFSSSQRGVTPKPESCPVEVMTSPPSRGALEVGTLEFYNGTEPKTLAEFKEAVAKQVCGVGGDAVVAIADDKGQYTKGTVFAYTDSGESAPPVPSKPGSKPEVKPTQVEDSEIPKSH
jgi:hypothetical protein